MPARRVKVAQPRQQFREGGIVSCITDYFRARLVQYQVISRLCQPSNSPVPEHSV
jgi:hypothetical protein